MAVKKMYGMQNVLDAAKTRIRNMFACGAKVYMSFSSGKDSLCMSSLTYDMIRAGEISAKQLVVIFIDEEGLYPSMVEAAERWRKNFLSVGAEFRWYCLPFRQVSVIDNLSATESWITWDPRIKDKWMRDLPDGAITYDPNLKYIGECNYQTFCDRITRDGLQMIGIRTDESLTRLKAVSRLTKDAKKIYPIYDWKDNDVWLYIKERRLEFPEIYMRLYEAGVSKRHLRLCCFFGDCGTQGLRWIAETDHELWERIERREPNAYLALLYWDSEMFARSTRKRRELEGEHDDTDYKEIVMDMLFKHPERYNISSDTRETIGSWKKFVAARSNMMNAENYRYVYESLTYGDPKRRRLRTLYSTVMTDYIKNETGSLTKGR